MATKQRNQVRKGKHGGMQLLLTDDVAHLGKQGDLVEVKHGYGRNYLLPQGLATVPTPHNLKLLELHKKRVNQAREAKLADLKVVAEQIARVPQLTIEANPNPSLAREDDFAQSAAAAGMDYDALIQKILDSA